MPFREIQNLSKTYGGFGTLELEFEGDYKMTTQLSLALFSPTEAMRAEQAVEGAHRAHVSTPAAAVPDW